MLNLWREGWFRDNGWDRQKRRIAEDLYIRKEMISHFQFLIASKIELKDTKEISKLFSQYLNLRFPWIQKEKEITADEVKKIFEGPQGKIIKIKPRGIMPEEFSRDMVDKQRQMLMQRKKEKIKSQK